jgi:type III pantothenate kinase
MVRPTGEPVIIVDSGTATTVDLVGADGVFAGGAILAGFELSALALHRYTALLPLVPPSDLKGTDPAPVGKNTRDAIRSGLFWGHIGAVKELVARLGQSQATVPQVILTGGAAALLAPHLPGRVRSESNLPLKGLAIVAGHLER